MKKSNILFIAVAVLAIFIGSAKADFPIGSAVGSFKLPDTNGAEKSYEDLKGKNGTVFVFLSTTCPVVKSYNERLNKISADYAAKGINLIGINSNVSETTEGIKKHAADNYKFTVLIDKDNIIADKFTAKATPEAFFFDKEGKLAYHGGIDNSRTGENITNNALRDALDAFLAGKTIAKTEFRAIGCTIQRKN
jgi:peroxiredoxin